VREYDSSRSLFSSSDDGLEEDEEDEDGEDVRTGSNAAVRERRARPPHVTLPLGSDRDGGWEGGAAPAEPVQDSMEFENMLLRDAPADSNAANLMGLSYGSTAMMRHMLTADQQMGAGLRRASMNVLDEVLDSAGWEERALFYLHTVTVNWVLLWIMLARYCMAALAGITNGFLLGQRGLAVFSTKALIIVDVVLAIALAFPVNFAVALELKLHGLVAFLSDSYGNTFDILLLVPLSAACCVLSILGLIGVGADTQHVSKMTLLLFWPTLSLLLLWRMGRTIGSRISLAQYFKSTHSQTKSLDFIWVSKSEDDDEWLVREMLPLTEEKIVRLHRYVTRGDASRVEPWTLDYANIPLRTQHKRPDWDEVFAGIAGRSKSGSVIGVFYCGPPAMARGVEQGAMKAMATSTQKAYKQGYMQAMGDSAVERNGNQAVDGGSSHGCAVRFALREENFG
jgi:Ferric reductase NAD binding domain